MSLCLVLSLLLPQDPVPALPPLDPAMDVVELVDGGRLQGTIEHDTPGYVEIRLSSSSVVGFERAKVARVLRRAEPVTDAAPPAAVQPALSPRDQWFVLHDAVGRVVGRLHATVALGDQQQIRLGEEWQLRGAETDTEITVLEVVRDDLTPISVFWHERQVRQADRKVQGARLVRGTIEGGQLVVELQTLADRTVRRYGVPKDFRLPLAMLETLRQRRDATTEQTLTVFDSQLAELVERRFAADWRRKVEWRDQVLDVRELRYGTASRHNAEWLDASCQSLRREVNGQSLVAVATTAELAERYLTATGAVFPSAVAVDPNHRFALWLPQPSWKFAEGSDLGTLAALAPLHGASASLVVLDQLAKDAALESAADAIERWLELVRPGFVTNVRADVTVRGRPAVLLRGRYEQTDTKGYHPMVCEVYALRGADGTALALCLEAPKEAEGALRADFDRILASVELTPGDLSLLSQLASR